MSPLRILIVTALGLVGVELFRGHQARAGQEAIEGELRALSAAIEDYRADHGQAASSLTELRRSVDADLTVRDRWGRLYHYERLSDESFRLMTYGRDGLPGGEGEDADVTWDGTRIVPSA